MTWQDFVFSLGNIVFTLTLIPTMKNEHARVPRWTSVPIALMLCVYTAAFASLTLAWAAVFSAASAGCWGFIAWKRGGKEPWGPPRS